MSTDRTTRVLASIVVALIVTTLLLHARRSTSVGFLRTSLTPDAAAALRVDEQYRVSAVSNAPSYDVETLAGSGAPGVRDGVGLFAQFLDPIDMSLSPDGRFLFVLDDGGRTVRRVDTRTRAVTTTTLADFVKIDSRLAEGFDRIVTTPDGVFLLDRLHRIVVARDGRAQIVVGGPIYTSDLIYSGGRLLAVNGGGDVWVLESSKWRVIASFPSGAILRRLCVDGDQVIQTEMNTGRWGRFDLSSGRMTGGFTSRPGLVALVSDIPHQRCLALFQDGVASVSRGDFAALKPMVLSDIQGRLLDRPQGIVGYQRDWLSGAVTMAYDSRRNMLYALSRRDRRVTAMLDSFGSWNYSKADPGPRIMSSDQPPTKEAGGSRILWLSHSVFWYPAGLEEGNLAVGAPRQLELLLNATEGQAGKWEVLNPALTGTAFYTTLYPNAKDALDRFGFDYAVLTIDLQALYFMLIADGYSVPAAFDASGLPVGIDAELARQPLLQRQYAGPLRPLVEYMRTNLREPSGRIPLLKPDGAVSPGRQFVRAWAEDKRFQRLVLDAYIGLIKAVQKACDDAGVKLTVLVAPITAVAGIDEWNDALAMGGGERPYDFESLHRPILERFWSEGIPTYDLTFDLLARHPRFFPFNAPSHHRSELFHRALAESVAAIARRFNIFSFEPAPERIPSGQGVRSAPPPPNVVVTARNGVCFVLHDMWEGRKTPQPSFAQMLAWGVADATRHVSESAAGCSEFRVSFVYVKNKDDYGNRDFRGIDRVASMRLPAARLKELETAAGDHTDTPALRAAVEFGRQ